MSRLQPAEAARSSCLTRRLLSFTAVFGLGSALMVSPLAEASTAAPAFSPLTVSIVSDAFNGSACHFEVTVDWTPVNGQDQLQIGVEDETTAHHAQTTIFVSKATSHIGTVVSVTVNAAATDTFHAFANLYGHHIGNNAKGSGASSSGEYDGCTITS